MYAILSSRSHSNKSAGERVGALLHYAKGQLLMSDLTNREQEFVNIIVDWYRIHDLETPIDTEWIMEQMFISKSRVSYLKKSLVDKGMLQAAKGYRLTDTAIEGITQPKSNVLITVPLRLPLLGQVRAGRTKQDELRVYLEDRNSPAAEIRTIPSVPDNSDVFLLEVIGESMLHDNILEGDYVLVKPFPRSVQPKQGQLIVTRYLPQASETEARESGDFSDALLEGPTVKYYRYVASSARPHHLRSYRETSSKGVTIETTSIDAIGYVIGTYRDLKS